MCHSGDPDDASMHAAAEAGGRPDPLSPLLYTAEEARELLGKARSADWLKRKAGIGLIPCTRIGRTVMWSRADLEELIRANYCDPKNYGRKRGRRRSGAASRGTTM